MYASTRPGLSIAFRSGRLDNADRIRLGSRGYRIPLAVTDIIVRRNIWLPTSSYRLKRNLGIVATRVGIFKQKKCRVTETNRLINFLRSFEAKTPCRFYDDVLSIL